VQIPDSVSISALWNDYIRNLLRISPNFIADQKCDRFYVWCFGNHKPEVDIRFYKYAESDFSCFGLWSPHF